MFNCISSQLENRQSACLSQTEFACCKSVWREKKKKKDATVKAGCCEQEHAFESSCFLGYA